MAPQSALPVAVVTGANKGIGLAVVRALCQLSPWEVILTSRSRSRGQIAIDKLKKEGLHPKLHQLDLLDVKSIGNLKSSLMRKNGGIDLLINNAAVSETPVDTPVEQMKVIMETNYFGNKKVFDMLQPLFNPGARVVNVSSGAGLLCNVGFWKTDNKSAAGELKQRLAADDLSEEELDKMMRNYMETFMAGTQGRHGWPTGGFIPTPKPYVVSKVGLSALTRVQQRKMDQTGKINDIVVSHVHPGFVDTDMNAKGEAINIKTLTPEESIAPILHASFLPKNTKTRGEMFWENSEVVNWVNWNPVKPIIRPKKEFMEEAERKFGKINRDKLEKNYGSTEKILSAAN